MSLNIAPPTTMLASASFPRRMMSDPLLREVATEVAPAAVRASEQLGDLISSSHHVRPLPSDDQVADQIRTELASGDGVPADLLERYATVSNAVDIATRATRDLTAIAQDLVNERDQQLEQHSDDMLAALHERLTALLTSLPDDLESVPASADRAIQLGRTDDYRTLIEARERYQQIRIAQEAIMGALWSSEPSQPGWRAILPYLENPADGYPALYEHLSIGYVRDEHGAAIDEFPWPELRTAGALSWLAQNPTARPWVPTRDQYRAALQQHESAQRAWLAEQPQQPARPGYPGGKQNGWDLAAAARGIAG